MVSKTLKRQRKNKRNCVESSAVLIQKIEDAVGKTANAKVRITHKMKSKRKYRVGGASPGDVYAEFDKFIETDFGFKCPKCGKKGSVTNFCSTCGSVETVDASVHVPGVISIPGEVKVPTAAPATESA